MRKQLERELGSERHPAWSGCSAEPRRRRVSLRSETILKIVFMMHPVG
jgi:hypothetical protein